MNIEVDIQRSGPLQRETPSDDKLASWICTALAGRCGPAEVSLRLVGEEEGRQLNRRYRNKDYATNVLSFPAGDMGELTPRPLGDIVLCVPVVWEEISRWGRMADAHWAHLCVHGALHLLGLDHETDLGAREMEGLEVEILARLGYQDPYRAEA